MEHLKVVSSFLKETQNHAQKVDLSHQKIQEKQANLKTNLTAFSQKLTLLQDKQDPWAKHLIHHISSLNQMLSKELKQIAEISDFSKDFDEKLLFLVTGKVNAGKSSLGNLIAGHGFELLANQNPYLSSHKPKFCMHRTVSSHVVKQDIQKFEEKATECTSSIQSFSLGNQLTWIDTPGLSSMTPENGELAKTYLKSADLVIFTVSSDSPMDKADIEALVRLGIDENKPFVIIVTKFDVHEEDFDPIKGDLVQIIKPKPNENKKQQLDYILSIIQNFKLEQKASEFIKEKVLFTSVRCAKKAIEDKNDLLWKESGMVDLYLLFNDILNKKGTQLKQVSAKTNFNAMLDRILTGTTDQSNVDQKIGISFQLFEKEIERAISNIKQSKNAFTQGLITLKSVILADIHYNTDITLRQKLERNETSNLNQALQTQSNECIKNRLDPYLKENLEKLIKNIQSLPKEIEALSVQVEKVEDIYQDVQIKTSSAKNKASVFGGGAFGLIGTMLGGPVGGFLGGLLGSALTPHFVDDHVITKQIKVGNNLEVVYQNTINQLRDQISQKLDTKFSEIEKTVFDQVINELHQIQQYLGKLKTDISSLKVV